MHIAAFVGERHAVGEGVFDGRPSDVNSQGFVGPRTARVKRLMPLRLEHPADLRLRHGSRRFRDDPDDSWHTLFDQEGGLGSLCETSYWSRREGLNAPPADYDSAALPIELHRLITCKTSRALHCPA